MKHLKLMLLSGLAVSYVGCTLDFNDFDPYTQPGAFDDNKPEPVDMDVMPDVMPAPDMDEPVDMLIDMDPPLDTDGDGVLDDDDNCPEVVNPNQLDADMDDIGDLCDDSDGDGVFDYRDGGDGQSVPYDNCIDIPNPDQLDSDWDGLGDLCDDDPDGDGLNAAQEQERGTSPTSADSDGDGIIDQVDLCPLVPSLDLDSDEDGIGNACDLDDDGDMIPDWIDACPYHNDPEQETTPELAAAGRGSACETDFDADGITDDVDPCPLLPALSDGTHPACTAPSSFSGFDADVREVASIQEYIWSASTGGLSAFTLSASKVISEDDERRFYTKSGLWSAKSAHVAGMNSAGPNRLLIRGVWVVSGGRLSALRYDGVSGQYWAIEHDLSDLGVTDINDISSYQGGVFVGSTTGLYSVRYDGTSEVTLGMLANPNVTALEPSLEAGAVWVATGAELYLLNVESGEATPAVTLPDVNEIRSVRLSDPLDPLAAVLILTDSEVIFLNPEDYTELYPRLPISAYDVVSRPLGMYFASVQGLVAGAPNSEVSPAAVNAVDGVNVSSFAQTSDGIVIGSASSGQGGRPDGLGDEGGLRAGGGVWIERSVDGEACITKSLMNTSRATWIATYGGLYQRDPDGIQSLILEKPIYDLYSDGQYLWAATQSGLARVSFEEGGAATEFELPALTPPFTAVSYHNGQVWVGGQNGVAYSPLDDEGNPTTWVEFINTEEANLPLGEIVGIGSDGATTWIAVRGPEGGIARYNENGFNPVIYSQNNALIPSNLITDLSVSSTRVVITTESGVSIMKPVIANVNDLETLYVGQGIPNAAQTSSVLSVADTGDVLWLFTAPSQNNPYGGLISMRVDGPQAPLRTIGTELFYSAQEVDVLKSQLPQVIGDRPYAKLSAMSKSESAVITLATCGDDTYPGGLGVLDSERSLEVRIGARGLPGSQEGVIVPSPRGHVMFTTPFGRLSAEEGEEYGPGETRTVDLYLPLAEGEEWPEGQEPRRVSISAEQLSRPIRECHAFVQVNEPVKRMICLLEGNYIAQHIRNTWSVDDERVLPSEVTEINAIALAPDNPANDMWLATDEGLFNIRNGQARVLNVANTDGKLPSDRVNAIVINEGLQQIYIGTNAGVVSLGIAGELPEDAARADWAVVAPESSPLRGPISALNVTEDGSLWVGASGGAARVVNDEVTLYAQGSDLPASPVTSITTSGDATYFAHSSGVSRLKAGVWSHYGSRMGASGIIGSLLTDDRGAVWALTPYGALGFNPAD